MPDLLRTITPQAAAEILAGAGYRVEEPSPNGQEHVARLFEPLDWETLTMNGVPEITYLEEPYIPASARIWVWGPADSSKSMYAGHLGSRLTNKGLVVCYFSQENPLAEDVRRLDRLRPDWSFLRFFHDQGLDLANPEHRTELFRVCEGAALVVFDTLTSCWSGDGEKNAEVARLDREALVPLTVMGVSSLVIDHTGHPQAFVSRQGVLAGRGASSKGQKADVVLDFRPEGGTKFSIVHAKNRLGGHKAPKTTFMVVDLEDEGLGIVTLGQDLEVADCANRMVEAITTAGSLTSKALREAVRGRKQIQSEAMELLMNEDPPRVRSSLETVETARGHQKARVWRLSQAVPVLA